ncbi:MAG: hypothetical protein ABJN65_11765 [Parasphingorhabdus sp.]
MLRSTHRLATVAIAASAVALFTAIPVPGTGKVEASPLTMHTKSIPSNGTRMSTMRLERGKRYKVRISGQTHFGTWKPTRRALKNDACFEFNSGRGRVGLPVVKSSHGLNFCRSGYRSNHKYESQIIYGDGRNLSLWVYDTDYRDNYGSYYAEVILMR